VSRTGTGLAIGDLRRHRRSRSWQWGWSGLPALGYRRGAAAAKAGKCSMIQKNRRQFSEKIMLKQKGKAG